MRRLGSDLPTQAAAPLIRQRWAILLLQDVKHGFVEHHWPHGPGDLNACADICPPRGNNVKARIRSAIFSNVSNAQAPSLREDMLVCRRA